MIRVERVSYYFQQGFEKIQEPKYLLAISTLAISILANCSPLISLSNGVDALIYGQLLSKRLSQHTLPLPESYSLSISWVIKSTFFALKNPGPLSQYFGSMIPLSLMGLFMFYIPDSLEGKNCTFERGSFSILAAFHHGVITSKFFQFSYLASLQVGVVTFLFLKVINSLCKMPYRAQQIQAALPAAIALWRQELAQLRRHEI